jgi:hypothetical protein
MQLQIIRIYKYDSQALTGRRTELIRSDIMKEGIDALTNALEIRPQLGFPGALI